jgi:hypothetical protein
MAVLAHRLYQLSRHSSPRQEDIHLEFEVVRAITYILNHRVGVVTLPPAARTHRSPLYSPPLELRWPAIPNKR